MAEITRKQLVDMADRAVNAVQAELGADYIVSYAKGTYGSIGTIKLDIVRRDGESFSSRGERDFKHNADLEGLEPGDWGAQFLHMGEWFTIVDYKVRATKMPIIGQKAGTDKRYKFRSGDVRRAKPVPGAWRPASKG